MRRRTSAHPDARGSRRRSEPGVRQVRPRPRRRHHDASRSTACSTDSSGSRRRASAPRTRLRPLRLTGLMRAEVRVYWTKLEAAPIGDCATPPPEIIRGRVDLPHGLRDDRDPRDGTPMTRALDERRRAPTRLHAGRAHGLARRRPHRDDRRRRSRAHRDDDVLRGGAPLRDRSDRPLGGGAPAPGPHRASRSCRRATSGSRATTTTSFRSGRRSRTAERADASRYGAMTDDLRASASTSAARWRAHRGRSPLERERAEPGRDLDDRQLHDRRLLRRYHDRGNNTVVLDDPARPGRRATPRGRGPHTAVQECVHAGLADGRGAAVRRARRRPGRLFATSSCSTARPARPPRPPSRLRRRSPARRCSCPRRPTDAVCGAHDQEEVTINPVQTVRWWIEGTSAPLAPDVARRTPRRQQVRPRSRDPRRHRGVGHLAPGGPQVVAEYAIDLKFGITVDDPGSGLSPPTNQISLDMDTERHRHRELDAGGLDHGLPPTRAEAPQRVRSVRFRLATRAALPDRTLPLPSAPGAPYLSRYCVVPGAPCNVLSRAHDHVGGRARQPGGDDLLMKPIRSLSSSLRRARARRAQRRRRDVHRRRHAGPPGGDGRLRPDGDPGRHPVGRSHA